MISIPKHSVYLQLNINNVVIKQMSFKKIFDQLISCDCE